MQYGTVYYARNSEQPVETAARELSVFLDARVEQYDDPADAVSAGNAVVLLVSGTPVVAAQRVADGLEIPPKDREWELTQEVETCLIIAGRTARNLCRAALRWIADPKRVRGLATFEYPQRLTMWDNTLNTWHRHIRGFDKRAHIRELARMGHTAVEVNRYALPEGWHVRNRTFPDDSYVWYLNYLPALDAFADSPLTRGIYPSEDLERNLADLKESAAIARSYGLAPGFAAYEPRCVSEAVFRRHPHLRGSRVDHQGRSLEPRYALDVAHPAVLEHYRTMLTRIMEDVPDLAFIVIWTSDSGSGFPYARKLYFGPNGSYLARSMSMETVAAGFASALLDAGRTINPEFEVMLEMTWEYDPDERQRVVEATPKGVTTTQLLGDGKNMNQGTERGAYDETLEHTRSCGKDPVGEIIVSSWWTLGPIFGVPFPHLLAEKFELMNELGVSRFFTRGGAIAPPLCPVHINQDLYCELIETGGLDRVDEFLEGRALRLCNGSKSSSQRLLAAWNAGERAMRIWPILNWYHQAAGPTQGRWITRPLVPNIDLLTRRETFYYTRKTFTMEWDPARRNIVFEGGVRQYTEEELERCVAIYDSSMVPEIETAVAELNAALEKEEIPFLVDQRDRYMGFLLLMNSIRNLFEVQAAINRYVMQTADRDLCRRRVLAGIDADIENTKRWIDMLRTSPTQFYQETSWLETPMLYRTLQTDLEARLPVMIAHRDDEPGPYIEELFREGTTHGITDKRF